MLDSKKDTFDTSSYKKGAISTNSRTPVLHSGTHAKMVASVPEVNGKKRFVFNKELKLTLVNCIGLAEAHVAKYGEVEAKFNAVFNIFCASHEVIRYVEKDLPLSKVDTLRQVWEKLERNRRADVKKNVAVTGIPEEYGELKQGLDKLIEENDDRMGKWPKPRGKEQRNQPH